MLKISFRVKTFVLVAINGFHFWFVGCGRKFNYFNFKQGHGHVLNVDSSPGVATILYEARLGCLEENIPKMSQEYIEALHLMFSSFKTTMYAGAIPKWLRPIIPKPWEEFCSSWDGLFKFSKSRGSRTGVQWTSGFSIVSTNLCVF